VNSILSVLVCEEAEFVPVGCLPGAGYVLVGKKAEVDVFSRELELVHEDARVALVDSDLLVSVDSNQGEADLLNIDIMYCGMGKDVVGVEVNRGDGWVVESAVSEDREVVVFVPGVSNSEAARQVVSAIGLESEDCIGNVLVGGLEDVVDN